MYLAFASVRLWVLVRFPLVLFTNNTGAVTYAGKHLLVLVYNLNFTSIIRKMASNLYCQSLTNDNFNFFRLAEDWGSETPREAAVGRACECCEQAWRVGAAPRLSGESVSLINTHSPPQLWFPVSMTTSTHILFVWQTLQLDSINMMLSCDQSGRQKYATLLTSPLAYYSQITYWEISGGKY